MKRLGPPPSDGDPKKLRIWNAKLLAEVQWLSVNGLIAVELAASIRANAGSLDRALPTETKPTGSSGDDSDDDDDKEDDDGPAVEPFVGLRVA